MKPTVHKRRSGLILCFLAERGVDEVEVCVALVAS